MMMLNEQSMKSDAVAWADVSDADVSESPRSTSAGSDFSGRSVGSPGISSGGSARDHKFEAMDSDLTSCDCDSDEGPAARLSVSRVGLPVHDSSPMGHLIVKNTFFDTPLVRPDSLDDFYRERKVLSCPATRNPTADTERLTKCVQQMEGLDSLHTPSSSSWAGIPKLAELRSAITCIVQNTFISTPLDRPESLDGFLEERRVLSCPATRHQTMDDCDPSVEADVVCWPATPDAASCAISIAEALKAEEGLSQRLTSSIDRGAPLPAWLAFPLAATGFDPRLDPSMLIIDSNDEVLSAAPWLAAPAPCGPPPPPVDRAPGAFSFDAVHRCPPLPTMEAGAAVSEDARCLGHLAGLGSAEMPSLGSVLHASHRCKPCSFAHKAEGCGKGRQCPFCHLCDGGEKKRREKAKKDMFRRLAAEECSAPY